MLNRSKNGVRGKMCIFCWQVFVPNKTEHREPIFLSVLSVTCLQVVPFLPHPLHLLYLLPVLFQYLCRSQLPISQWYQSLWIHFILVPEHITSVLHQEIMAGPVKIITQIRLLLVVECTKITYCWRITCNTISGNNNGLAFSWRTCLQKGLLPLVLLL